MKKPIVDRLREYADMLDSHFPMTDTAALLDEAADAIAALTTQPQPKKCEKHPRYVTEPFCPDCRSESERALSAQQEPKPTSDELEKVIADFCENFECDGADGEDKPVTDAQRKFARGVIDGLLADPAWDELWGRQIEEMMRQRMAAQPQQEPVAWTTKLALDCKDVALAFEVCPKNMWGEKGMPLYTAPPPGVREGIVGAVDHFRDAVLNQCGAMAENGMNGDQVNDVLRELDSIVYPYITRAAEQVNADHSEDILDMVKECPVAGGSAVRAADDSLSAAGGSPAFILWAQAQFGEARPVDLPRLQWAYEAGVKQSLTTPTGQTHVRVPVEFIKRLRQFASHHEYEPWRHKMDEEAILVLVRDMERIAEWGCDQAEKYDGTCAGDIVRLAQSSLAKLGGDGK